MPGERTSSSASEGILTRRVLIVDDDADSADLLVHVLRLRGHDTRSVDCGRRAVAEAVEFLPHVAILDVGLPDMSGFELAPLLRKCEGLANCKLIAVTGYSGEATLARCKLAGFDLHLVKPVDLEILARSVVADVHRDAEPPELDAK